MAISSSNNFYHDGSLLFLTLDTIVFKGAREEITAVTFVRPDRTIVRNCNIHEYDGSFGFMFCQSKP